MIHFLKKRMYEFKGIKILWMSCVFAFALLGFHIYQFIDSGFRAEAFLRVIFYSVCPFIIFLFGNIGIVYLVGILAFSTEQFNDFTNYTSFFFLCEIIILSHKPQKIIIALLYILDVVIVCQNHDKSAIHLTIHFIGCAWIYFFTTETIKEAVKKAVKQFKENRLILSDKEKYILSEMAKGAKQKEIEKYSENTVSKILKKCREKNFCSSNSELLMRFISEIQ